MNKSNRAVMLVGCLVIVGLPSCMANRTITLERPVRATQLDAYNVFVGDWDWQAETTYRDGTTEQWSGDAQWEWTLDRRSLHGVMSCQSDRTTFRAAGVWTWHPKKKRYLWWMFNDWGYPQEGKGSFDAATQRWTMSYRSVGLDGTTSFGQYEMDVSDRDRLEWTMVEWAFPFHLVKKMEMTGAYVRR